MAKRKRDVSDTAASGTGRGKKKRGSAAQASPASSHPHGEVDYTKEYKIRSILKENAKQYLIDWEDDSDTGEKYEQTWEPKANANELAVADWERKKAERRGSRASNSKASPSTPPTAKRKRGRPRKVIESSPPVETPLPASNGHDQQPEPAPEDAEPTREIAESQQTVDTAEENADSPLFVPQKSPTVPPEQPQVQLSDPPSSYLAGAYEKFGSQTGSTVPESSSLKSSDPQVFQSTADDVENQDPEQQPKSQVQSTQSGNSTSLVIPDSQSQGNYNESSSFKGFSPDPPAGTAQSQSQPTAASSEPSRSNTAVSIVSGPTQQLLTETSQSAPVREEAAESAVEKEQQAAPQSQETTTEETTTSSRENPPEDQAQRAEEVHEDGAQAQAGADEDLETSELSEQPQTEGSNPVKPAKEKSADARESDTTFQEQTQHSSTARETSPEVERPLETQANGSTDALANQHSTQSQAPVTSEDAISLNKPAQDEGQTNGDSSVQSEEQSTQVSTADKQHQQAQPSPAKDKSSGAQPSSEAEAAHSEQREESPLFEPEGHFESQLFPESPQKSKDAGSTPSIAAGAHEGEPIFISSENEHGQSSSLTENVDTSTQANSASNYEPPPAGQRPPPSSVPEKEPPKSSAGAGPQRSATEQPTSGLPAFVSSALRQSGSEQPQAAPQNNATPSTQSSFPFQTQIGFQPNVSNTNGVRKFEGAATTPAVTTLERALFNPHLPAPATRASSAHRTPDSSPFPSIPSHSLGTVGESAPRRLQTPSDISSTSPSRASMDSKSSASKKSGEVLGAKLRAMREQNRSQTPRTQTEQPASSLPPAMSAEVAAAQAARLSVPPSEGARSPSTVPAKEPTPVITREEMNTSERYDTLLPQAQGHSSVSEGHNQNGALTSTGTPGPPPDPDHDPEIVNVHVVPIGLQGHQRDQYFQNIYYHSEMIDRFLEQRDPSEGLLGEAERFLDRLRSIAMHPDLVNPETLSQASTPERQAQWDVDASAKFRFLHEFLERLSERNIHAAVAAHGDRVPEMLETFLQGIQVPYKRSYAPEDYSEEQSSGNGLRVTIVNLDHRVEKIENADIVVALDGSITYQHPIVRAYREHPKTAEMEFANNWAGMYTLVVPRTIEHIERCMVPNMSRKARARVLVNATQKHRYESGRLEAGQGQVSPKEAAISILEYLDDPEVSEWPLAGLSAIEDLDSQEDTEMDLDSHYENSDETTTSAKRPLESPDAEMSNSDPTKRQRLDTDAAPMPTTINPQDMDITHISDSLGKATESNLMEESEAATQQHLHEALQKAQDRLEEHVKALEDLQYRHEAQRTELVQEKRQGKSAVVTAQNAMQRMTLTETNNTSLRTERTALKEQLEEANRKLLDHSVPERAEFEKLRLQSEQDKLDKEKFEKRAQATEKDHEYTREKYQDASFRAQELAQRNRELEEQLAVALTQAEGEAAKARAASQDTRHKALERENKKLKAIVKDRDAGLKFRDEEIVRLKEASRGRMGTRGSSVPRSPRVGSPIKGRGAGSRQASPAAGDVSRRGAHLHPLRNG